MSELVTPDGGKLKTVDPMARACANCDFHESLRLERNTDEVRCKQRPHVASQYHPPSQGFISATIWAVMLPTEYCSYFQKDGKPWAYGNDVNAR